VQEPQLRYDEEQEDDAGASRIQQVLQPLPSAHRTQRDKVNDERGMMNDELKDDCFNSSFRIHHSSLLVGV
jgi:hypothetical protein